MNEAKTNQKLVKIILIVCSKLLENVFLSFSSFFSPWSWVLVREKDITTSNQYWKKTARIERAEWPYSAFLSVSPIMVLHTPKRTCWKLLGSGWYHSLITTSYKNRSCVAKKKYPQALYSLLMPTHHLAVIEKRWNWMNITNEASAYR